MNIILKSLTERLSNYSQKLEKQAMFVDKIWAQVDEDGHHHSYIFESNGELMMSKNGMANMGTWKYYPQANSIRINLGDNNQILLNHGFLNEAVMILKYDGANNEKSLILVDKKKVPDLNVINYLKQLDYKHRRIRSIKLDNGNLLVVENGWDKINLKNHAVKVDDIDLTYPNDGSYFDQDKTNLYSIKNGTIISCAILKNYIHRGKKIIIAQRIGNSNYYNGDLVFSDDFNPLQDGTYTIGTFKNIRVKKGKIDGL